MDLDEAISEARRRKEERVAQFPDDADLRPTVIFERAGRVVATVESPTMDKRAGLLAAHIGAQGYGADAVTIMLDAHVKLLKPGETPPRPGELQRLCDEEGACDLDLISDALVVERLCIADGGEMASCPYKYHGPSTKFRWTHGIEKVRGTNFDGRIAESLAEALEAGRQNDAASAIESALSLDRALARVYADRATTIALERMDFIVTEASLIIDPTLPPATGGRLIISAHS